MSRGLAKGVILTAVVLLSSFMGIHTVSAGNNAGASRSAKCTVAAVELGNWGKAIKVRNGKAYASFSVKGKRCTTAVTLASWKRPTKNGINDQILFARTTKRFSPGRHTLAVNLPKCMWQVDVVQGARATAADGTANYQYQNGQIVDGGLRDFKKGGKKACATSQPEPETPTPVQPSNPDPEPVAEKPVESVDTSVDQEPQEQTSEVAEPLPSTGAGSVITGTLGLSSTAGIAYSYLRSKRQLKELQ